MSTNYCARLLLIWVITSTCNGSQYVTLGAVGISLLHVGSIPRGFISKDAFYCCFHHIHAKHTLSIDRSDDVLVEALEQGRRSMVVRA